MMTISIFQLDKIFPEHMPCAIPEEDMAIPSSCALSVGVWTPRMPTSLRKPLRALLPARQVCLRIQPSQRVSVVKRAYTHCRRSPKAHLPRIQMNNSSSILMHGAGRTFVSLKRKKEVFYEISDIPWVT